MNARTAALMLAFALATGSAALADDMGTPKPSPTASAHAMMSHGSMMSHGTTKASPKPSAMHSNSMHSDSMHSDSMMSHGSPKPSPSAKP